MLIIRIFYSSGLRLSELLKLMKGDIHEHKPTGKIIGKGEKFRIFILSKKVHADLWKFINEKKNL